MGAFSRLDNFIKLLFFLVLPLLLYTTASMLSYSLSNTTMTAFQSGLFGFIMGGIITVILRKFVLMTVFEIPPVMLLISYFVYALFFYTLLQGVPFLVLLSGIFVGLYYRRSYVFLQKPSDEYEFKVFQLSFLTAVTIGLLSLFTSCLLFFKASELSCLKQVQPFIDSLPRPTAALVLVTSCAIISLIQFLLTKATMLYKQ